MRLHEYEDALLEAKKDEANMTKSDYLRPQENALVILLILQWKYVKG